MLTKAEKLRGKLNAQKKDREEFERKRAELAAEMNEMSNTSKKKGSEKNEKSIGSKSNTNIAETLGSIDESATTHHSTQPSTSTVAANASYSRHDNHR